MFKILKKDPFFFKKKLKENYEEFHGKIPNAILIRLPNLQATKNLKNYLSKKKIYIRNNFPEPNFKLHQSKFSFSKKIVKIF